MLNEIPSVDAVEEYVLNKLKNKDRIMGFGHRVYKAKDPRANENQKLAEQLAKDTGNEALYLKSNKIEEIMAREVGAKGIYPNVDFYSATTYHCIGLKLDLFTPMFAMSRLGGWSGHVIEQLSDNRLFRPRPSSPAITASPTSPSTNASNNAKPGATACPSPASRARFVCSSRLIQRALAQARVFIESPSS